MIRMARYHHWCRTDYRGLGEPTYLLPETGKASPVGSGAEMTVAVSICDNHKTSSAAQSE